MRVVNAVTCEPGDTFGHARVYVIARVAAAVAAAVALAAPVAAAAEPPSREFPVRQTELTLTYAKVRLKQGGQRVHVTIPVAAGVDRFGDPLSYRWDTHVRGGPRCQPGALPDLTAVAAGTVIDAPLPMPPGGWCRGLYGVALLAIVTVNCGSDPPPGCRPGQRITEQVAAAPFDAGRPREPVCHPLGQVDRCWYAPSLQDRGGWTVTAPLDDLLGPDGATMDADPYFWRAFRGHPVFQRHWETDDDTFYGWATRRSQALRMARIVDRLLHTGPYHGKDWPGRPAAHSGAWAPAAAGKSGVAPRLSASTGACKVASA